MKKFFKTIIAKVAYGIGKKLYTKKIDSLCNEHKYIEAYNLWKKYGYLFEA